MWPLNGVSSRRLAVENSRLGRQEELRQSRIVDALVTVRVWMTRAQEPRPSAAATIVTEVLIAVAVTVRTSSRLNSSSRVRRAAWTIPSAVKRKAGDIAAKRACTCGSPYSSASGQERPMPRIVIPMPSPALIQNAVDASSSERFALWTRAEPMPASVITRARLEKTSAIATRPTSLGVRKWATTTAVAKPRN